VRESERERKRERERERERRTFQVPMMPSREQLRRE
jgi:hypothetical protein